MAATRGTWRVESGGTAYNTTLYDSEGNTVPLDAVTSMRWEVDGADLRLALLAIEVNAKIDAQGALAAVLAQATPEDAETGP